MNSRRVPSLPDPLQLDFYFSARDDKIVQLIILRNQFGT
jgi:hypothetical protein